MADEHSEEGAASLPGVWAGVAKSHSGDLFLVGAHDLTGKLYDLGSSPPNISNVTFNLSGFKFGPGLGASVELVLVVAKGFHSGSELNGQVQGGVDFDLAVGAKLSSFLKGIRGIGRVIRTIEDFKRLRYGVEHGLKNLNFKENGIFCFPIPFLGVGSHAWASYKFGTLSVVSIGTGVP